MTSMHPELGKLLVVMGVVIALTGLVVWLAPSVPWLGKLPGDISIKRENLSFHFPLATCLVISTVLSLVLYIFRRP
ncbi:MAG: hypothetical protein MOGMAGMI_02193 [Candidatus Omnitrophica bacterium]|nr:hypothetical protein [Candidatus Omnitrophota bacterium]